LADLTNMPPPAPDDMLRLLAARLAAWVDVWEREGFRPVRRAWLDQAVGVGEMMLLRTAHEETEGRFMDLDQDGALLMQTGNGQLRRVAAGDVTPLVAVG
jgi:BirA family biotin operon repressor/biotin-[acetyl-CoA-carboxylase] ligase